MSREPTLNAGILNGNRRFRPGPARPVQTLSNADYDSKNYNTIETRGGRAALKLDLGDNWTVTPTFMGQSLGRQRLLRL